jgi:hypothetical protein
VAEQIKIRKQYEISIINTIYSWFDWLIYIHMLLAQVDMFLLELITDTIAIYFVTRWYIRNRAMLPVITTATVATTVATAATSEQAL